MASLLRKLAGISWPNSVISHKKCTHQELLQTAMFGFPAMVSRPNIARLLRKVSSSSQPSPSGVSDFPTAIAFSRHRGEQRPPRPQLFTCLVVDEHPTEKGITLICNGVNRVR